MQILLKSYGTKEYVWEKAAYKNGHYYVTLDGEDILVNKTNIVSVKGIDTNKVVCNYCGEFIDNTPEAIEAHFAKSESKKDCINCEYLKFGNNKNGLKRIITQDSNGHYFVKEEFSSDLYCGANRLHMESIENKAYVHANCPHLRCRYNGVGKPTEFFHKYPGAFDTAITVDNLNANKLRFDGRNGGYFLYDMKSRDTIKACVNNSGIVECFRLSMYSTGTHYFVYSEKYDKLFFRSGSNYEENAPYWIKQYKLDEMKKKIKALYEGAK